MPGRLARNWEWVALRGVAALIFGLITLFTPAISLEAFELLFGVFALADGVFAIASAATRRRQSARWLPLLVGGILGVAFGVVTLVLPGMTALALLYIIAAWALVTGSAHFATAIRLRTMVRGEFLLVVTGVLWIVLAVLLVTLPAPGVLTLLVWIGAFATVAGILLLGFAFRLRRRQRQARRASARRAA